MYLKSIVKQRQEWLFIIFLMYDNELFYARYIYKYENFYILMVIVN